MLTLEQNKARSLFLIELADLMEKRHAKIAFNSSIADSDNFEIGILFDIDDPHCPNRSSQDNIIINSCCTPWEEVDSEDVRKLTDK